MRIKKQLLEEIIRQARREAPREACGFLMADPQEPFTVSWLLPAENVARENPETRFVPASETYLEAVNLEAAGKAKILGVYHSHPGGDPEPSAYDLEMAVPGLVYLILALRPDREEARAWKKENDRFLPVQLEVEHHEPEPTGKP